MRVLIADRFSDSARADLAADGDAVAYEPDAQGDALALALSDFQADVLVVRSTRVSKEALQAGAGCLRLVIRAGAGYNTIDTVAAKSLGVQVANCPGMNANAVAEIAFGLIITLDRQIVDNTMDLRRSVWRKSAYSSARGLAGSILGIIGVGRIGRAMIRRAKPFDMQVVAWSRSLTAVNAERLGIAHRPTPIAVAQAADVVSLHVPLTDTTRGLADRRFFEAMRPGSIFVNTSRAEVVDEAALGWAVRERGIRAGLDVFSGEPPSGSGAIHNPLFALDGVIGTHHIGGQTAEAQQAIAAETVRIIRRFRSNGVVLNSVFSS